MLEHVHLDPNGDLVAADGEVVGSVVAAPPSAEAPDASVLVAHFDHDEAAEGCPYCEVRPMLKDLRRAWETASPEAFAILWSLSDGYGEPGLIPPQGYDWSGIRDSSPAAIRAMHRALHA